MKTCRDSALLQSKIVYLFIEQKIFTTDFPDKNKKHTSYKASLRVFDAVKQILFYPYSYI